MNAEAVTLGAFLFALCLCIFTGTWILYALLFGIVCFSLYSMYKGNTFKATCSMLLEGMMTVSNILTIFILIGCLTASWRVSGTIPFILYHSISFIQPRFFVLCAFLMCCLMSFLTGTSFGTASTMGVICMLMSNAAGLNPVLTGGAILSGSFFGDRCSPMSSSAQLVCSLTRTDIYANVRSMLCTCIVPLLLSCLMYMMLAGSQSASPDMALISLFQENFSLHWTACIPAVVVLLLAILHVHVRYAILISTLCSFVLSVFLQGASPLFFLRCILLGYRAPEGTQLAALLNGGGMISMATAALIVLISASYSGIFAHTPLLLGIKGLLQRTVSFLTPFGTVLLTSFISAAVSCNQSLGTILTCQICQELYAKKEDLAMALENTVILVCALIPWGIAGAVPLSTIGAPISSMLCAFYLYLQPLWNLTLSAWTRVRLRQPTSAA